MNNAVIEFLRIGRIGFASLQVPRMITGAQGYDRKKQNCYCYFIFQDVLFYLQVANVSAVGPVNPFTVSISSNV